MNTLSRVQLNALELLLKTRHIDDDGWTYGGRPTGVRADTIDALRKKRLIEVRFPDIGVSTSSGVRFRVTSAGVAATILDEGYAK